MHEDLLRHEVVMVGFRIPATCVFLADGGSCPCRRRDTLQGGRSVTQLYGDNLVELEAVIVIRVVRLKGDPELIRRDLDSSPGGVGIGSVCPVIGLAEDLILITVVQREIIVGVVSARAGIKGDLQAVRIGVSG